MKSEKNKEEEFELTKELLRIERERNRELVEILDKMCDMWSKVNIIVTSPILIKARETIIRNEKLNRGE